MSTERYEPQTCPRCGSISGFHEVEIDDGGTGCLMFVFGGFIPFLLYQSGRSGKIECENCGLIFRPTESYSTPAIVVLSIIVLAMIVFLVYVALR